MTVLELREGSFEFLDNYGGKRTGRQRLFPRAAIFAGKRASLTLVGSEAASARPVFSLSLGTIVSMPNVTRSPMLRTLAETDPEIAAAVASERRRQSEGLELIASENFVSQAILETAGSVLTNKYAEGYPGKRYYGGCEFVDVAEALAIARAKALFGADHANVQPHSGAPGQHVGVFRGGEARRHRARHGPRARRPPHARPPAQLLRASSTRSSPTACGPTPSRSTTRRSSSWRTSTSRR